MTIPAQWEGMGDVGSARYEPALLPPCPTIRVLSYSDCQEIHPLPFWVNFQKFSTLRVNNIIQFVGYKYLLSILNIFRRGYCSIIVVLVFIHPHFRCSPGIPENHHKLLINLVYLSKKRGGGCLLTCWPMIKATVFHLHDFNWSWREYLASNLDGL